MFETRMIDLLLLAFLIYVYIGLRKERKRVRVLSHFVFAVIYFSVDTAERVTPGEERGLLTKNELTPEALWNGYLNSVLERIARAVERDSRLPTMEQFIKSERALFQGEGFPNCTANSTDTLATGTTKLWNMAGRAARNEERAPIPVF